MLRLPVPPAELLVRRLLRGDPVIAGDVAVRAWINGRADLVGPGNPIAGGAFDKEEASPQGGAYVRVDSTQGRLDTVAEQDPALATCGCSMLVYSQTKEAASTAAAALAAVVNSLNGNPEPAGASGITVLMADTVLGPVYVPQPQTGGEQFCYQVSADFLLALNA